MTADMFTIPACATREWPSTRARRLMWADTEPTPIYDAVVAELGRVGVLTPCGARVCTGCATCVKAWAARERIDLDPWQAALVDRIFPPARRES